MIAAAGSSWGEIMRALVRAFGITTTLSAIVLSGLTAGSVAGALTFLGVHTGEERFLTR
jgi:hypothetical protein